MQKATRLGTASESLLRQSRDWALYIAAAAFLTTFGLHSKLGTYSRFIADDFCSAGIARRFGVPRAVWYWYLNWTGRYTASALDAVFGLLGPGVTPFVTAAVLVLWLGVLTHTVIALSARNAGLGPFHSLLLAATLLYLTLSLSPNVPQSLYWGQGMRSIVPPLIMSAVYASALLGFGARPRSSIASAALLGLGFAVALIMGGLNETFAVLEVSALVFALVLVKVAARNDFDVRAARFLLVGAIGAGVALVLVISAPGNAFRQAFFPRPPGLSGMMALAGPAFVRFLRSIFGRTGAWMAVVGGMGLAAFMGWRASRANTSLWRVPLILVVSFAFAFLCFLPAAYGLSDAPPERTLLIPAHMIAVGTLLSSFVAGKGFGGRIARGWWRAAIEAMLLILGIVASLGSVAISNRQLLSDQAVYAAYAVHWDAVNAQILEATAAGSDRILIPTVNNWAGLNEPNDNPKFWVNVCYRQYYGIEVLAADGP